MSKPTKDLIEAQAVFVGGSLTELPYTATSGGALAAKGSGWWGSLYVKIAREMTYRQLAYEAELLGSKQSPMFPADWTLFIPNTAQTKPQQALDQIFVSDPIITVKYPGKSADAREKEKEATRYLMGKLQGEERESDISPLQEQTSLTLNYGLAARMVVLDVKRRWPEKPEPGKLIDGKWTISPVAHKKAISGYDLKRRGKDPFVTRTLSPFAIAYDRANNPMQWCMIREPIMPWDAQALYPHVDFMLGIEPRDASATALCWTQYWTPGYYACYVDGKPVLTTEPWPDGDGADEDGVAENPYGFIPVWPSGGAFGELDVAGRPEVELAGIMRWNLDTLRAEAMLANVELIHARRAGFGPKALVEGMDETDTAAQEILQKQIMGGPEGVVFLPAGVRITPLVPSELPKSVLEMRAQMSEDIDRGITYDVAAGDPNPSQSGVSRQIVQQQIGKRVQVTSMHLKQSLEASLMGVLAMIRDVLQESVSSVYGSEVAELNWKDIPQGPTVTVDLLSDSAVEKARKAQEGLGLWKEGVIDLETLLRDYIQMDDPDALRKGLLNDAAFENVIKPMFLQLLQGQGPALIAEAAQAAGIQPETPPSRVTGATGATTGQNLRVGPTGAALPGEAVNPANMQGTAEQMNGQTPGTREVVVRG